MNASTLFGPIDTGYRLVINSESAGWYKTAAEAGRYLGAARAAGGVTEAHIIRCSDGATV